MSRILSVYGRLEELDSGVPGNRPVPELPRLVVDLCGVCALQLALVGAHDPQGVAFRDVESVRTSTLQHIIDLKML